MKRRGAMELSTSTIVVVVLSILILVLGVVFVNNIMCGAIDGVKEINEATKTEIMDIFSPGDTIVIKEFNNEIAKGVE